MISCCERHCHVQLVAEAALNCGHCIVRRTTLRFPGQNLAFAVIHPAASAWSSSCTSHCRHETRSPENITCFSCFSNTANRKPLISLRTLIFPATLLGRSGVLNNVAAEVLSPPMIKCTFSTSVAQYILTDKRNIKISASYRLPKKSRFVYLS